MNNTLVEQYVEIGTLKVGGGEFQSPTKYVAKLLNERNYFKWVIDMEI